MPLFSSSSEKKDPDGPPAYPTPPPMGMNPSGSFQPPQGHFGPTWACLLLASSDKIRLLGFSGDVVPAVEEAVARVWAPGIQKRGPYDGGGYEIKMSGNPWYGQGSEAVPARRLVAHILHALAGRGWHLSFATDLSKKQWDKDTLYFKPGPPRQRYFFPISFNESDKIRLIDSPNPQVTSAFQAAVSSWPLGIQDVREKAPGCLQMKLKGTPWWTTNGTEVNYSRLLGCSILSAMDGHGFELVASIDMSATRQDNVSELDSWFFADK